MSRLFAFLLVALAIASTQSLADTYPKNPKIDIRHYVFQLVLSDDTDVITCEATIDVHYKATGVEFLRLDLVKKATELGDKGMTVNEVTSDGKPLAFTHEGNILMIRLAAPSTAGQRTSYVIRYSGIPATGLKIANNKYGERTFFSDNWPDKGRNWLPLVDHPYDKATCEFKVTAPAQYQVVSNGLKLEESDLPNGMRLTHWKQSVPIAPWLYVLGVARFAVQYVDTFDHKSIQTWVYHQDREKGFYDFALPTKQVLEFYSDRIGPFAYEKLANIQSNSVSGGMEAASAILYSEGSVVGDRNERWRNVVIHEIAHQWFGNAVTEYDWDDVWLSEGFATYFTLLFIEHAYGHDAFLRGLADSKKKVLDFDAKNPGYRIIHDNLNDMSKVTSSQTYQKGSWVLHMLRGVMGDDAFWKGIRSYYARYMNGNATTADFRNVMEEASGMNLNDFFAQWLYKPGNLKLTGTWKYNTSKKEVIITLEQVPTDGNLIKMPIQVALHSAKATELKTLQLTGGKNTFTLPAEGLERVELDPNSWLLMEGTWERK